jgi:transposase
MTFVGLDLHKHYVTACALDASGAVVAEAKRLPVTPEALDAFLAALPGPVTVAMEATLYWAWLAERLEAAGHAVRVAHAHQVKLIWQARCKTDAIDARKLAELLRANLLPAIWVADPATRARAAAGAARAFLVRQRTQLKNRIHGHLTAENQACPATDLYGKAGRTWLAGAALSPALRRQVDGLLRLVDTLTTEIRDLDRLVQREVRDDALVARLQTIPGVGVFGAAMLAAEIGPVARFRSSHELAAYAGLVPSTHSSGGRTTHGGVSAAGNRWLKWILIEVVQTLKLAPGPIGAYYQRLLRAKGKPKATVAAARKLCCYLYWMLKEGWSYDAWLRQHVRSSPSEVRPIQRMGAVA